MSEEVPFTQIRYTPPMQPDKPFSPEKFKELFSQVPRICIDVIIRSRGGIVLALRSLPSWHGKWHITGGSLLYQESVHDATKRIAKREVNADVEYVKTLGFMEFPSTKVERGYGHDVSIAVLVDHVGGELFTSSDEASEIRVFSEIPPNTILEQEKFLREHWGEITSGI